MRSETHPASTSILSSSTTLRLLLSAVPGRYWRYSTQFDRRLLDNPPLQEHPNSDRVAFEVGWDHGSYVVPLSDRDPAAMHDGWKESYRRGPLSRTPNRYISKWLQVRRSAWHRQIPVADAFTPEYIELIDVPTCPIADERLTHALLVPSDWSVERLDNSLGYTPGNVAIVSRRINEAKGRLSPEALETLLQSRESAQGGKDSALEELTATEVARLLSLLSGVQALLNDTSHHPWPAMAMSPGVPLSASALVSAAHVQVAMKPNDNLADLGRFLRSDVPSRHAHVKQASNALLRRVRRLIEQGVHPCDVWLSDSMMTEWLSFWRIYATWELANTSEDSAKLGDAAYAAFEPARRLAEGVRR